MDPVTAPPAPLPPAGLVPWDHPSPLVDALGGFLLHPDDPHRAGFRVEGPKVNARGLLHAGTVATIADVVIGHAVAGVSDPPTPLVTVHLSCDLIGSARQGDWVDVTVGATRLGRRLGSGTATMTAGGRDLARVSALFLPV
ncbi:PaaI family thioesterase [Iamia sp. SCSIO 61187]|uniref:PaaI family thioesterase n=1 Tax=Iamia sp. SCSIO 61187 TaxID=2722752 RepID=UPI001C627F88|nr:PaaI family thioesterase [Iamia sp. SCSIO 61187]QYG91896.1 PaaI family thioesterase [Iamia sp. SCSIO 61187]